MHCTSLARPMMISFYKPSNLSPPPKIVYMGGRGVLRLRQIHFLQGWFLPYLLETEEPVYLPTSLNTYFNTDRHEGEGVGGIIPTSNNTFHLLVHRYRTVEHFYVLFLRRTPPERTVFSQTNIVKAKRSSLLLKNKSLINVSMLGCRKIERSYILAQD